MQPNGAVRRASSSFDVPVDSDPRERRPALRPGFLPSWHPDAHLGPAPGEREGGLRGLGHPKAGSVNPSSGKAHLCSVVILKVVSHHMRL